MLKINPILLTDSYKVSHYKQYPPKTEFILDYLESRGGDLSHTVSNVGLQYILKSYMCMTVTQAHVDEAEEMLTSHFMGNDKVFNKAGWQRIVDELDGKIPLKIRAVPEGTLVPVKNVLMTIENTHPDFAWLVGWFETLLLKIWYPMTIATRSFFLKQQIEKFWKQSADESEESPWGNYSYHNFGDRGSTTVEASAVGGFAHLTSFLGSDNLIAATTFGKQFYSATEASGNSIEASEHSVICSYGKCEDLKS